MADRPSLKKRSWLFKAFERAVLGVGMTIVAFFIERRLIKAIKTGSVEPAARTGSAEQQGGPGERVDLSTTSKKVADQPGR